MLKAKLLSSSILLVLAAPAVADPTLVEGFKNPPQSARPRVWWHWMSGNVTEEGIKLDLEWMKRIGVGGAQTFDADLGTPQVVDKRLTYMTPEWKHAFRFAAQTADRLGLELAIASSPGWSESGGPWVSPEDGMKKLVWSETEVAGGKAFSGTLAAPPHATGPFLDAPMTANISGAPGGPPPELFQDTNVVAYRSAAMALPLPKVTASAGAVDSAALFDGKLTTGIDINVPKDAPAALRFDYDTPQTIRSATIGMPATPMFTAAGYKTALEASVDGVSFVKVGEFPSGASPQYTISFPAFTAKALRLVFNAGDTPGIAGLASEGARGAAFPAFGPPPTGAAPVRVNEVRFSSQARVNRGEDKAGFAVAQDYYALASGASEGVAAADVIDLTGKMTPDGHLNWTPPAGNRPKSNWKVLRMGYTLTGTTNHPATKEATGLEVDKYDADAVRRYINTYLDTYHDAAGIDLIGKRGVRALLNDSTEVDPSNWSPVLPAEFRARRGYDLTPWLPALTGVVVQDSAKTDAFLYDFRKTLGELMAEAHYQTITQEAHKRGLIHYSEALEDGRPVLGDDMAMRRYADVPMSAMWTYRGAGPRPTFYADVRGAASVAHIYGQNLVAAESLTAALSPWAFSPRDLQPMIDMEFALGVNRPVIHTSVHQPLTDHAPGFSLFIFGQYFNRLDTWAEQAKPWVDYIARNAYMLQQGRFVADVAYFYGEEAPLTALYKDGVPTDTPTRNGFDYVNPDVLLNMLSVEPATGDLVAKSGARYKVLYLGGSSSKMSLQVLRRLNDLVQGGATVVGKNPAGSPALMDDPTAFAALADGLWGGKTGKGKVLASHDINAALTALGVRPDFDYKAENADAKLMFVHRKTPTAEIYYFTNRKDRAEKVDLNFSVVGETPMSWDAATGTSRPVPYSQLTRRSTVCAINTSNCYSSVPAEVVVGSKIHLNLRPYESGYIVFQLSTPYEVDAQNPAAVVATPLSTLADHWSLSFQPNRGAPTGTIPATLGDLSTNANPAIKYFSGTASYTRTLNVKPAWLKPNQHLMLDLGEVRELAEVIFNGTSAGIAWKPPYKLDVTKFVRPGVNKLEVKVTNLWVNRLIGDAQPGAKPITFTTLKTYNANAPLRPSGLMGPVVLVSERR